MVAILGYSRQQIAAAVQEMYTTVADAPDSPFHFPVGRAACQRLGYPETLTADLPDALLASFAGVGYPFRAQAIQPGDRVLDIGAGAGNDTLIASRLAGPEGRVIALDLTAAMTRKLKGTADQAGYDNLSVVQASAEALPLADASIDSITSNGALNLVPDKRRAVAEMFRVLRPNGRLQLADVVIHRPVSVDCHEDPRLWVECVVGATVKEELLALFAEAGFEDVEVVGSHDYFALSPSRQTREVAQSFGAHAIEVGMRRGEQPPSALQRWWRRLDPRRAWLRLERRGLLGMAALALALVSCYGTLALVGLLPLLGIGLTLNEGAWAGTITLFVLLTLLTLAAGYRHHRHLGPTLLAAAGSGTVLYALFIDYQALVELAGFVLLAGAALWDLAQRRRQEARALGLGLDKG
ncbi:methyltransferase domain-containing protein [Halomonas campisalis]|uniref:Methyltransferase domain-containing protein n=1 Tax=Billgrantia campisalis TaxID=74661 RepID=A0ABS9P8R8_9GAMM|nr:MerC family mercury resistance protein [Halomonas campisalis]MCG6658171.1 methyltransferase domain-containing protein [Halomonas campisalis]MDR5862840.1 MerC family mercury resistance protein [Halomonas campisalis]